MPIKHAAMRQIKKDVTRAVRNQGVRSELKTLTKRLHSLLQGKKLDEAKTLLRAVASKYDRAVTRGIIHRNVAARYKSRLTQLVNRS
jgi:small subunit ribosomal protein S20